MSRGYSEKSYGAGRIILHAVEDPQNLYLPGGVQLDPSVDWYQGGKLAIAGTPLVQHAANGLYRPWLVALAVGAGTSATALIVSDASLFSVGGTLRVGSDNKTISAINYETNTITLNTAGTWTDGSVIAAADGYVADNPIAGILSDEYGVRLDDEGGNHTARLLVRGRVKADMILSGNAVIASKVAGNQTQLAEFQFWRGDSRLA